MNLFVMILLSLVIIVTIILILWNIETKLPKLNVASFSKRERFENVSEWFNQLCENKKFNGVIYYEKGGEVLINESLGHTSHTLKSRINTKTMFRLSSVSKQFTAFGIMLLKHNKLLNYEDNVKVFIPDFPFNDVTIRELLNQTSGILVDYIKMAKKHRKKLKGEILTNETVVEMININYDESFKAPQKKYFYNNTNYIILAHIIEIISKMSFEDYMRIKVFEPLGLTNTRVWNLLSEKIDFEKNNMAEGFEAYLKSKPKLVKPNWIDGVAGDGAVFSCIEDLIKWSSFWEHNPLLTNEELMEAFKVPTLEDGTKSFYGFGWVIVDENTFMHDGRWLASNAIIIKKIREDSLFIMLDNSTNLRFEKILKELNNYTDTYKYETNKEEILYN